MKVILYLFLSILMAEAQTYDNEPKSDNNDDPIGLTIGVIFFCLIVCCIGVIKWRDSRNNIS